MSKKNLSVRKSDEAMVGPCESTPSGTLGLSVIDTLPALRYKVRTLHVFRHGPNAAPVIRAALSKALVHYYPLAGRLLESSEGLLQLSCTGDGVWFVQASADCSLEAIDYLDHNHCTDSLFDLLPDPPLDKDAFDPLVLFQVTQFACEGFVIGLEFSHCVCDGFGAAQFLKAVAESARGLQSPTIAPVWCREAIPTPAALLLEEPIQAPPQVPVPSCCRLVQANMDMSLQRIAHLKRQFFDLTGQTCSTFEALAATVWRHRTRAIDCSSTTTDATLVFFANARGLMEPPLPEGFYGNCFFPVIVTVPNERLKWASHVETVKLIQQAKAMLPAQFDEWMEGKKMDGGCGSVDPFLPPLSYSTLFVSEWSRLGFGDVDYGWGPPVHVVPVSYSNVIPGCIMGRPPAPQKGVRLMTWCVREAHLKPFRELLMEEQA